MSDPAARPRAPSAPDAPSGWSPAGFRERFAEVAAGLDAARTPADRERSKQEIIALFKGVEAALGELTQIREEIRGLVDRYKQAVASAAPAQAPQFTGQRPAVHADHIGASTFIEKGWSLISLGDHAGAIQVLQKALALSPGAVEAQSLLGWAQMLSEQYDEALATFSRVLMNEPANALARINVGYICLRKGIFGEAIEHLSKAIRLDNDRKATLYAHYYLGLVYFEREMYEDAQTFFRKTLKLGPNLIEAWFELGRALWFGGQRDEAIEAWREGHRANKFNPWARRCREMLDLVESGGAIPRKLLT
jgi:tetratricopeptide (TPR) repeat protein